MLNVSSASVGSESDNQKQETSDAELKKQLKIVKAKRRKKRNQKLKKKSELQDIRVFPKFKWMELKVMYKNLQKQQIAEIKHDLGMKVRVEVPQYVRIRFSAGGPMLYSFTHSLKELIQLCYPFHFAGSDQ